MSQVPLRLVVDAPVEPARGLDVEALFQDHARYVAAIALRLLGRDDEVDDVVQDVFLVALQSLASLRQAGAIKGWLATVTVRLASRRLRLRRLRVFLRLDAAPDYRQLAVMAGQEQALLVARLYRLLDRLPVAQRTAWILRHVEGEPLEAVAALCRCSLATAKRRIAAAQAIIDPGGGAMSERGRLERALGHVRVHWDEARERRVHEGLVRRQRARRHRQRAAAAVAAGGVMLAAALALRPAPPRPAPAGAPAVIFFDDGSTAHPLGGDSVVRAKGSAPDGTVAEVARGGARFEVKRVPGRSFRVEAGGVAVEPSRPGPPASTASARAGGEAPGTRFTVERMAEHTRIAVQDGLVRVSWDGEKRLLRDGESGLFPPGATPSLPEALAPGAAIEGKVAAALPPRPSPPSSLAATPSEPRAASASPPAASRWRELAEAGDFDGAYAALVRTGAGAVRDDPAELLLAADVARLSRHPSAALAPLRQVTRAHRDDPRAPLAAFTLGRVLLDELGDPRAAAAAFADAAALAPAGALTEDASAREVEALSRAGEVERARERAREYLTRYPRGHRTRLVRRYGGLD